MLFYYDEINNIATKENILITGGAGFLGSWTAKRLLELGHNVCILDNLSTGELSNVPEGADFIAGDASDQSTVHNVFRIFKPNVVYSMAAFAREGTSVFSPISCVKDNINCHLYTLVEAIRSENFRKVIYFSSMAVYGDQTPPFTEDMSRKPCDPYGECKSMCEGLTESLSKVHHFEYSIVRPHNCFGVYQSLREKQRNVIAIFINSIMRKEPITIYGDGENTRAFSYVENSIEPYVRLMNEGDGQIYNIGDDTPITINEVARIVMNEMEYLGYKRVPIIHTKDRPLEVKHSYTSFDKQYEIGYRKIYNFTEGVSKMCKWADSIGPKEWLNIPVEIPTIDMPKNWR